MAARLDIEARADRVDAAVTEMERLRESVDQLHLVQVREREQLAAYSHHGRQIAHAIANDLSVVVGVLALLAAGVSLTDTQVADANHAGERVRLNVEALHQLVRQLAPEPRS